jgi:uncharacterized membrane protein YfcA
MDPEGAALREGDNALASRAMWNIRNVLFLALGLVTVGFVVLWWRLAREAELPRGAAGAPDVKRHGFYHTVVGFVMCFFDTLGIGNFATTTSAFKLRRSLADERIPGTLNVGYAIPTIAQAFIYIAIVRVDQLTLALMIVASVLGAWLGAGVVAKWPRRTVQIGMGLALLGAAGLMLAAVLKIGPPGGTALELRGATMVLGLAGNFLLGALMTLGIGLYAPCLILVSLLGMHPGAAFPIMMGSCAFLMPIGGLRFIRAGSYDLRATLAMTLGGLPAVLIAAYIVKSLPLDAVRGLVVVVVVYTAAMMLWSARAERRAALQGVSEASVAE